jgi:arsenate reductase
MAAALFNALAPSGTRAASAGTRPAPRIHPEVVEVMQEVGIRLEGQPRELTRQLAERASLLVTMGCGEECPYVPGLRREDWDVPDPKGQPLGRVRQIRDEIAGRVEQLVAERGWEG